MGVVTKALDAIRVADGLLFPARDGKAAYSPAQLVSTPVADGWTEYEGAVSRERLARLYEFSGWVRTAADLKAEVLAKAAPMVYRKVADRHEPEPEHPFLEVWADPNPADTALDLQMRRSLDLDLYGHAFWYILLDGALMPAGLWPLDPARTAPVFARSGNELISHYRFDGDRGTLDLPAAAVLHFRNGGYGGTLRGLPTVRSIYPAIAGDVEAARYQMYVNRHAFRPPAVFSTTEEMDPEEARELSRDVMASFGGPKNAGNPLILWSGLAPVKAAFTPAEADLVAARAAGRDEILAGFRISKGSLGITDDLNRATAEAMEYALSRRVAEPALMRVAQRITARIMKPFYGEEWEFRFDGVVPIDEDRVIRKVTVAGTQRVITKNEGRRLLFPDLGDLPEGGDELMGKPAPAPPPNPRAEDGRFGQTEEGGAGGSETGAADDDDDEDGKALKAADDAQAPRSDRAELEAAVAAWFTEQAGDVLEALFADIADEIEDSE